jgi:hypothetical protein
MTPTWAVVLVGLGSGLVGSFVTTLVRISHERGAELRSHMLNAADLFSTGTIEALFKARSATGPLLENEDVQLIEPSGSFRPDIQTVLDDVSSAVDEVLARRARVNLLFGDQAPAGKAASSVVSSLRNIMSALEDWPNSIREHEERRMYERNFEELIQHHEAFNRAALAALKETAVRRIWARVRR